MAPAATPDVSSPARYLGVIIPVVLVLVLGPIVVLSIKRIQRKRKERKMKKETIALTWSDSSMESILAFWYPKGEIKPLPNPQSSSLHADDKALYAPVSIPEPIAKATLPPTPQWPLPAATLAPMETKLASSIA